MKNKTQYLSLILTLVLLICTLGSALCFAAQNPGVGYTVTGRMSGGEIAFDIELSNTVALAGRLAIAFDPSKVQLKNTSSLTAAVRRESNITLTTEGLDSSVLLSNEKGHAMFAWYSSDDMGIDAGYGDVKIATVTFTLNDGVTEDDFNCNTFGLYYVNTTMIDKWDCSANIIDYDLFSYSNTSPVDERLCTASFDYPNCDVIPPVYYKTSLSVSDNSGRAVGGANVTCGSLQGTTNSSGTAVFEMESGVYPYRVSAEGYVAKSGYVIVNEGDTSASVTLQNFEELVRELAQNVAINFSDGDSEDSVTTSLGFPEYGEYGESIFWESGNTAVISDRGAVTRPEDDTDVTITATVLYGGSAARRTFTVTVKSRLTAEEKNQAIVDSDIEALEIGFAPGDSAEAVTSSVTLPGLGAGGSAVAWTSSNEEVMNAYGVLTRPESDMNIKLTAVVIRGTVQKRKEFNLKVIGTKQASAVNDTDIVEKVKNALEIGYASGDSAAHVTSALTLPTVGVEDTEITWESSMPAVITAYGGVVRQAKDTNVTLTATVKRGEASAQKTFNVTVPAAEQIPVNPDNGQEGDITQINNSNRPASSIPNVNVEMVDPNTIQTQKPADTAKGFADIDGVPWANEAILALSKRGVIKGTSETTFSPDDSIIRADFITLLMRMLDIDGGDVTEAAFDDVDMNEYYAEPVCRAKALGLITGVGDNKFDPTGYITRQDMMTMTYRALSVLNMADFEAADLGGYPDRADIEDYAFESVSKMVGAGYIKGDEQGRLNPTASTTRAETAVFLYRMGI